MKEFEPNSLNYHEANYANIEPEDRLKALNTQEVGEREENDVELVEEAPGEPVTDSMLREDVQRADSWLTYNKGLENTGFSPADRLTPENVDTLEEAYVIDTGTEGLQTNPIIVPGDPPVMYYTRTDAVVEAANARTGERYWSFAYALERYAPRSPGGRRGVSIYGDMVHYGTEDGFIIALDRYTGEEQWVTDLIWDEDLPEGMEDYPQATACVITCGLAYDGIFFTGMRTDQKHWTHVEAMDAETGETLWRSPNVDPDGWVGDSWSHGNSAAWMDPVIDPETEMVFFTTGDPTPWFGSIARPGPNRHSVSIRAFDMHSGENLWNSQVLAHEQWDYDLCSTPTVADVELDGEQQRVLIDDAKVGWTYVWDIETGELLRRTDPFAKQEHQAGDSEFLNFVPFGEENAAAIFPAIPGGTEWPPDAYSPRTNYRYVGAEDAASVVYAEGPWEFEYGQVQPEFDNAAGGSLEYEGEDPVARIAAMDLDSGEMAWEYEFDDVDPEMPTPWPGGVTATEGGLVFAGSPGGNFVALDDESGDRLWNDDTDGRIEGTPIVWDDPEEEAEYVAIASNDQIFVYRSEE